jgi:hypothetical protein
MEKSLNQLYKESGTTLSYKEWRKREDEKMASFSGDIKPPSLQDSTSFEKTKKEMGGVGGYKETISNKTIFGINKYIIIVGGVLIVSAIAYKIYKNRKQ